MTWQDHKQSIHSDFRRDGYVVLRGFYSPPQMKELCAAIDHYIQNVVPTLPPEENFFEIKGQIETLKYCKDLPAHSAYFQSLFASAQVVPLVESLLGGPVTGMNLSLFNKPPRVGDQTPPHQDGYYFMLDPMEALTVWLAVDPVDAENGCVRYVTGSNRGPMRPHQRTKTLGFSQGISDYGTPDDLKNEVAISAQPGDVLIHHAMTIHRADPNRSTRTRRAVGMVYKLASAKCDEQAHAAYQAKLQAELAQAGKI